MGLVQVLEIHGLEQDVGELRVGDALLGVLQTASHVFPGDEAVDGEILTDVPKDLQERVGGKPVVVVEQQRGIFPAVEVEEVRQLGAYPLHVAPHLLHRDEVALPALSGRVADQPGTASSQRDRTMSRTLEPRQRHQGNQMADMQAVRRGVEPDVGRNHPLVHDLAQPVLCIAPLNITAGLQNIKSLLRHLCTPPAPSPSSFQIRAKRRFLQVLS